MKTSTVVSPKRRQSTANILIMSVVLGLASIPVWGFLIMCITFAGAATAGNGSAPGALTIRAIFAAAVGPGIYLGSLLQKLFGVRDANYIVLAILVWSTVVPLLYLIIAFARRRSSWVPTV